MLRAMTRAFLVPVLCSSAYCQLSLDGAVPSGPRLWLRPDAGALHGVSQLVTSWRDQSANDLHVTQDSGARQPVYDHHGHHNDAGVVFDGSDFLARLDGMPVGSYTKALVFTLRSGGAQGLLCGSAGGHRLGVSPGGLVEMAHQGTTFAAGSVAAPLGQPTVLIASFDAVTGTGVLHQNGLLVGAGVGPGNTDPTLELGALGGDEFLHGAVAEVLIYDRVLTATERLKLLIHLTRAHRLGKVPGVEFEEAPRHGQIVARDLKDDIGVVTISGTVHSPEYSQLDVQLMQDGVELSTETRDLTFTDGAAPFHVSSELHAGLHEYEIRVYARKGNARVRVAVFESLACGDVYLVHGQSNAVAADFQDESLANQNQSIWVRSFGTARELGAAVDDIQDDLHWSMADGESLHDHGSVGAWALRLGKNLVDHHQVPVGILSGAVGATSIVDHQRNDADPEDLGSLYGRLLYRAEQAGVKDSARALFWYQGERDGEETTLYATSFQTLYDDWKTDYMGLEQIYLFQIRLGCLKQTAVVREVQRQLGDLYPDVKVMSTTAVPSHDGCHFHYVGYEEIGDRITRVVERDLYGSTDVENIDPPNILSASLQGTSAEIILTFRDPDDTLLFDAGAETDFLLDDGSTVLSGTPAGNTILLRLAAPSTATRITYFGHAGDGPWVYNSRGVGMLVFFDFPITP